MNNNTAHFGIDVLTKRLVKLGVGPNTTAMGRTLADTAETVAYVQSRKLSIAGPIFNITDLYQLIADATTALNSLDNDELTAEAAEDMPRL